MGDAFRGVYAVFELGNQRQPYPIFAGVTEACLPRKVATGEHLDGCVLQQVLREGFVVSWCLRPQVKTRGGRCHVQAGRENRCHRGKFFAITRAILDHVLLIAPCPFAGQLVVWWHGAAMVCAIALETLYPQGVACYKA